MADKSLKVLYLAAEVVPFAKTGGLADVAGALPKVLKDLGHDIRVAMPRYGRIDKSRFGLTTKLEPFPVPIDDTSESVAILESTIGGKVPIYFMDNDRYFNREGVYGYSDDGERFVLFCRAAVEMLKRLDWLPDIIHCNDWHTAIIPNYLTTIYRDDPFFANTATVFTIHNLRYQGIFGNRILEIAGIDEYGFLHHPRMEDLDNVVDLLARGINFADVINTVSETYAKEILTPEYGEKLDPLLLDRQDRLFGILNGIDYDEMNPATDKYIAVNYDVATLDKRIENKAALQRETGLNVDAAVPLVGMVSRLADQKGFDILAEIFDPMMEALNMQFVLLGTGDQHYHDMFSNFARKHSGKMAVLLTFNATLAQRIYSGADMFLMPSRFEPCGLGQLIALRYGCIPIVRTTGGLADTVHDFDPRSGEGNGFTFSRYRSLDLFAAIVRAIENYKYRSTWRMLQERGMQADYSWNVSAQKYAELYRKAIEFKRMAKVAG
ncbi:MAG: glycogen synthase GlgA [Chloroflexi bacterium]|nr:glycogen synthase GlgA [Chloroflexota bacterium]MCL5074711.1 glycogen synthase GlgA [Chloroflexota bacterium]